MSGSNATEDADANGTGRIAEPTVAEAVRSTESYETSGGTVFYDAENPLAWVQSDDVVDLEESA
ncbi:DUF7331 family protein [Natronomonas sp.]|uniref:DUF7331 family protein n=1 Tax=Natronomonas sp. TaxID=2184060 RepID=UPI00261CAB8A|nr:hypothetical protein [Natronomonas sp.]